MGKNNTKMVRKINSDIIRQELRKHEELTKAEVSSLTGLSIATCGNLLKVLVENGEVVEGKMEESTGGRPARKYRYNVDMKMVLCIYVLVDKKESIRFEVNNGIGERKEIYDIEEEEITLKVILQNTRSLLEKYENISLIGIGVPGVVYEGVCYICDARHLVGINLKREMEEQFNVKVFVEHEQQLKAYGYSRRYNLDDAITMVYLIAPERRCMGTGIIVNGKAFKGGYSMAGETQYLPYYYLKNKGIAVDDVMDEMTFIVSTMTAIINPNVFVLTGDRFDEKSPEEIREKCCEIIDEKYLPEIRYEKNSFADFREGLVVGTLKELGDRVEISEISIF